MNDEMPNILAQIPVCVFWKDCNLIFRGGNQLFAEAAGLQRVQEIEGKTDFDFPWASFGMLYQDRDRKVLCSLKTFEWEEQHIKSQGSVIDVWVKKSPLYDRRGYLIGIIGSYIEKFPGFESPVMPDQIRLPAKQLACLHFLLEGLTGKQIATRMNLSVRTVEYYITILKRKFACQNKAELLCKMTRIIYENIKV